jgi:hypothetical protein
MSQFAPTDCLSSVYPLGEQWVGKSTSGETRLFQSLDDYKNFLQNLASSGRVCPDVSVPVAKPATGTVRTPRTGFLEFLPRNSAEQKKYSAMSPYWEGQQSTEKALETGKFSAEEVYRYRASDVKGGTKLPDLGSQFTGRQ